MVKLSAAVARQRKNRSIYSMFLPPEPHTIFAAVRAHWSVENPLHWSLDVTFAEDDNRIR
jgi:predicted transposase YbfD/YdcC